MSNLSRVSEHMDIIGADGVHIGTVDKVVGDRIKMTKADSGSHSDHHHYISGALVAAEWAHTKPSGFYTMRDVVKF